MRKLAIAGNVAVDRIDGNPPSPGGCPSFAALALRMLDRDGQILTRFAESDRHLFQPMLATLGVPVTTLPAGSTQAFGFHYDGEHRAMTVDVIGQAWTAADAQALDPDVGWVHVAPLLRSDFPARTLAALADGRVLSYDGQGLVRVAEIGPLRVNGDFDRSVLEPISILKLAEDEAAVLAGSAFDGGHARALGVAEVVVTFGSAGCTLYVDGDEERVPAARPVLGVQTTGAGDVFMVGYVAARSDGESPEAAAEQASALVARMLDERKRQS